MAPESTSLQPPADVSPDIAFRNTLLNPMVPKIYANQVGIVIQPADISLLFGNSGAATGVLNMSYSAAKVLSINLAEAIVSYERQAKVTVESADEISARMQATQK